MGSGSFFGEAGTRKTFTAAVQIDIEHLPVPRALAFVLVAPFRLQGVGHQPVSDCTRMSRRFADPAAVFACFDYRLPGSSGTPNALRGDG